VDQDFPITENSRMKFILTSLLNNADVITLIIFVNEITSLLFKVNRNPGCVDDKINCQTNMKYMSKYILLSLSIEKEKQDLQKKMETFNMLISKDL
jgi:hypothetical protein